MAMKKLVGRFLDSDFCRVFNFRTEEANAGKGGIKVLPHALSRIRLTSEPQEGAFFLKDYMIDRINAVSEYILATGCTVRACAEHFKVSKTTVHKDMRERLSKLNPARAEAVSKVLDGNREERHIRGGAATKEKYARARQDGRAAESGSALDGQGGCVVE